MIASLGNNGCEFPSIDCVQMLNLSNNHMVKGYTVIVFENWFENSPIQKVEEAREKEALF
jgi:hypothetical protein